VSRLSRPRASARGSAPFAETPTVRRYAGSAAPERGGLMATKDKTQAKPQVDGSQDGASGGDSLSITDNRTGKSYEVEISDGTIRTMDLRQIKVSDDDFGLMGY